MKSLIQNVTKTYDTPKMLFLIDDCYITKHTETHTQIYIYVKNGASAVKKQVKGGGDGTTTKTDPKCSRNVQHSKKVTPLHKEGESERL